MVYYLITFANTHTAMAARKWLAPQLTCCILPTPRQISNSCGIAIRIDHVSRQQITNILAEASLDPLMYRLYRVEDSLSQLDFKLI